MMLRILALCARDTGTEEVYRSLDARVVDFQERGESWDDLIRLAEHHGMAPLLHKHLQHLGHSLPQQARRVLQSLALRSAQAARIRNGAVAAIIRRCRENGIGVVTVKGIALANSLYSEPGLRPMRDVDLLAGEDDLPRLQDILGGLGYLPEIRQDIPSDFYHLVPMAMAVEGMTVTVEVHRRLLPGHPEYPHWPLAGLRERSLPFFLDGVPARTLGLEEMLHHVYLHGFRAPLTYEPYRLIHLADLVTLVERCLDRIDWDRVFEIFPTVRPVLSSLHCLTPWSDTVLRRLSLDPATHPDRPGEPYRGWPRRRLQEIDLSDLPQLIRETLLPSQWWMQVYYGCLPDHGLWRSRWLDHPRTLYRWFKAYLLHRSGTDLKQHI